MGIREGNTGVLPSHRALRDHEQAHPAKRAPEALKGLEWVGWVQRVPTPSRVPAVTSPVPTLRARSPFPPPAGAGLPGTGLALKRARFDLILLKVSQNCIVSPKKCEKAWHSPCFQNGLRKSPLEILRFPFYGAFSHKELMGHFDVSTDFTVKMTKCRQMVHPWSREVVARYPHVDHAASCLCGRRSSSGSARYSH